MDQPDPVAAPARRHRRRRALIGGILSILLLTGGAVAVSRTSWWACHTGTRAGDEALDYSVRPDAVPGDFAALVEQIESVPGVDSLAGSATLEGDVRLVPNVNGDLLVSDYPYFAERNQFHDTSLDPLSGETSWSRGQAGQAAAPAVTGGAVLNFAAVEGGSYRLSILDAADGSVTGCIDVDRLEDSGIGRASVGVSPDGSTVVLATPTDSGSTASAFSVEDRVPLWETAIGRVQGTITSLGGTVVIDRLSASDVRGSGELIWGNVSEESRASLTALDAATGKQSWTWPADLSSDQDPQAGSTVPFVDGPDDVVVVSATDFGEDEETSSLIGLDATTGGERWTAEFPASPAAQGFGSTVLALTGDVLTALDPATGEEIWSRPVTGGASGPRPDYAQPWGDQVIVATGDGMTLVDLATGELTEIPIPNAWSMQVSVTDTALAVIVDDGSAKQLLVFARDT